MAPRAKYLILMLVFSAAVALRGAETSVPGVYQPYRPLPKTSPTPVTEKGTTHIDLATDTLSIGFKAGTVVRLDEGSSLQGPGWVAGVDLLYGSSTDLNFDLFAEYSSIPYKSALAKTPMTSMGIGIKALGRLFRFEKLRPFLQGGLGVYVVTRAATRFTGYAPNGAAQFVVEYVTDPGFGFTAGLGALYQVTPTLSARASLDGTSISIGGGSGDAILTFSPSAGLTLVY